MNENIATDRELTDIYLLSSMPISMYQNYRNHKLIRDLAAKTHSRVLFARYNRVAAIQDKEVKDLVLAYAYLIALGMRPVKENYPYLDKIERYNLDWADLLVRIMRDRPAPVIVAARFAVSSVDNKPMSTKGPATTPSWRLQREPAFSLATVGA